MRQAWLKLAILAAVAAAGSAPATAAAQCTASGAPANCAVPATASVTAGRVVRLQMSAGSTSLTPPTPADFDAGFNATTGPTLTVSANAPWTLNIRAAAATWTASNTSPGAPAWTAKPAGDLQWSTLPSGGFTALSTSDASLVSGAATANSATTLYFQTLYSWTSDTPGNYSLAIVLTLTAP